MSSSISRRSGRLATANLKLMNSSKLREVTVDVDNFSSIHSATKTARVQRSSQLERKPEEQRPENCPRVSSEWKFGAHVSSAGGVENAVINAAEIGANSFALFLKSQRRWTSPRLTECSINLFKSRLNSFSFNPFHVLPHGSYLINLGNPDRDKRKKSYACFLDDLQRCELLGLPLYNFHPGSTVGLVSKQESIKYIAECINEAHKDTNSVITVIENMAGSGNVIGSDFAEVASIIDYVTNKARIGICLDTCHLFAAGYDIRTREGYELMFAEFDRVVGLKYLRAIHLNDSKSPLNSKRDRHDNLGFGELGLHPFAMISCDSRLKNIPLILETPISLPNSKAEDSRIWKNEISVLNRLSQSTLYSTNGAKDDGLAVTELEKAMNELESVTGKRRTRITGNETKATSLTSGMTKGKRKREEGSEDYIP